MTNIVSQSDARFDAVLRAYNDAVSSSHDATMIGATIVVVSAVILAVMTWRGLAANRNDNER